MLNMEIEEYILFVDSLMEQICATLWGDGVGIKPSQAARVVTVPANLTTNKKTVTSFDEFQYFINTTTMQGGGLTEVNAAGAFTNCTALTSITLPDSLVTIGAGTFKSCSSLDITNSVLPNVTTIGAGAFTSGLSATSTFELDCPNLTSIGRGAFMNSNIYKVNDLGSITTLTGGNIHGVFYNCPRLVSASLPSTLTTLGSHCFEKCYSLTSMPGIENVVTFNEACLAGVPLSGELHLTNAQTLGNYLWQRGGTAKHATITKVYLPSIVTLANGTSTVGSGVFDQMNTLEEVYLGNNCSQIGTAAFRSCVSLSKCDIPSSVTVIGDNAFSGCSNLEIDELNLPNLTSIGNNSFFGGVKIGKITNLGSITSLPNGNSNYGIFRNCTTLTEVTLPNTLQTIGPTVFLGCSNCTKCNLPSSLTSIGDSAFPGTMVNVEEINLPNLTYLGANNFLNNQTVKRIVNLGTITSLPQANMSYGTFMNCKQLESAVLPSTLQTIGQGIFRGCTALTSVIFSGSSSLTTIQTNAFYGCTSLVTCSIPSTVTSIGGSAFSGNTLMQGELNLPNLTGPGADAFYNCRSLTKIKSLGSITGISGSNSYGMFRNCISLTEISLPNTLKTIGTNAFHSCTGLVTCSLPQSLTSIGNASFYNCTSLAGELNLPNLTSLGTQVFVRTAITKIKSLGRITSIPGVSYADNGGTFHSCMSLTEVTLPNTLTSIGTNTFRGCSNLETLIVLATTPPSAGDQFLTGTPATLKIYVPYSANHSILAAYQSATRWSTYASRIYELDANGNIPT